MLSNWTAFATNYSSLLKTMSDAPKSSQWIDSIHATVVEWPFSQIWLIFYRNDVYSKTQTIISRELHLSKNVNCYFIFFCGRIRDEQYASTLFTSIKNVFFRLHFSCYAKWRRKYPVSLHALMPTWAHEWNIDMSFAIYITPHNHWNDNNEIQWDICIVRCNRIGDWICDWNDIEIAR